MLKVGITGGIGSGKSIVCQVFTTLGIPVFRADDAARYLLGNDPTVITRVKALLGNDVYANGLPDRAAIAKMVFNSPDKLNGLNAIMHPATIAYGLQWMAAQQAPYVIKEAAIFFESGSNMDMDVMIGVYAPQELRIQRAMQRTGTTMPDIQSRIAQQMNEDEKMGRCNYVIINDDATAVLPQVLGIHRLLLERMGG
jgi:dephospho-CoA kinase